MKNIVFIIHNITNAGGTEKASIDISNMLSDIYQVTLISLSTSNGSKPFFDLDEKVRVCHLNVVPLKGSILSKLSWFAYAYLRLKDCLKSITPDVVFGFGHNTNLVISLLSSKNYKKFGCEHIDFLTVPNISRKMMKLFYPKLDGLIVLSEEARRKMQDLNSKIAVIPNSLALEKYESNGHQRQFKILLVGRLSEEKGYDRLVPIAKAIKKSYPFWKFEIYGNGDYGKMLSNLYKDEEVDDVITIFPAVKNIFEKYAQASVFIMTSYTEAMPMVLLEAKASGLPVIGYENEGTRTMISDGNDGFLIQDGDHDLFFNKLSLLLGDKELRERMSQSALKSVQYLNTDNVKLLWRDVID